MMVKQPNFKIGGLYRVRHSMRWDDRTDENGSVVHKTEPKDILMLIDFSAISPSEFHMDFLLPNGRVLRGKLEAWKSYPDVVTGMKSILEEVLEEVH